MAFVLEPTQALIAAIIVVVLVIVAWKFLKFVFRIAVVVAAAVALFLLAQAAGFL